MNRPAEAYAAKTLADGRFAYVIPIMFGRAYITAGTDQSDTFGAYDEAWTFESLGAALAALMLWDGTDGTEPTGWIRHQPSNRRREHGDPARESVRA